MFFKKFKIDLKIFLVVIIRLGFFKVMAIKNWSDYYLCLDLFRGRFFMFCICWEWGWYLVGLKVFV